MNMKEQLAIILAAINGKEVHYVPHSTEYIEAHTVIEGHQFNFNRNDYQIAPPYQKGEIIMVRDCHEWIPIHFERMEDNVVICSSPRGMELFANHRKLNTEERGKAQ